MYVYCACSYPTADEAMKCFGSMRTHNGKVSELPTRHHDIMSTAQNTKAQLSRTKLVYIFNGGEPLTICSSDGIGNGQLTSNTYF